MEEERNPGSTIHGDNPFLITNSLPPSKDETSSFLLSWGGKEDLLKKREVSGLRPRTPKKNKK